jgi:ribosomal protein S4E
MDITIIKTTEEKFEITITDGENVIFNDTRYYNYMDEVLMDDEKIIDTIQQLSSLFGELTVVQNDFDL